MKTRQVNFKNFSNKMQQIPASNLKGFLKIWAKLGLLLFTFVPLAIQ